MKIQWAVSFLQILNYFLFCFKKKQKPRSFHNSSGRNDFRGFTPSSPLCIISLPVLFQICITVLYSYVKYLKWYRGIYSYPIFLSNLLDRLQLSVLETARATLHTSLLLFPTHSAIGRAIWIRKHAVVRHQQYAARYGFPRCQAWVCFLNASYVPPQQVPMEC